MVIDSLFPNEDDKVEENGCVTAKQDDKIGKICTCSADSCNQGLLDEPTGGPRLIPIPLRQIPLVHR